MKHDVSRENSRWKSSLQNHRMLDGQERLSSFINPSQSDALAIVLDISFICATALMPIVVYLVFRVKAIGKYRWYILNGLVWDYLYDVMLAMWKPVTFLPNVAAYSNVSNLTYFPECQCDIS